MPTTSQQTQPWGDPSPRALASHGLGSTAFNTDVGATPCGTNAHLGAEPPSGQFARHDPLDDLSETSNPTGRFGTNRPFTMADDLFTMPMISMASMACATTSVPLNQSFPFYSDHQHNTMTYPGASISAEPQSGQGYPYTDIGFIPTTAPKFMHRREVDALLYSQAPVPAMLQYDVWGGQLTPLDFARSPTDCS
jgi:hypothetical protein